jgi:hypothetical protein
LRKDLLPDDCPAVAIEDVPFILFLHNVCIIFSLEKTQKKQIKFEMKYKILSIMTYDTKH